MRYHEGVGWGEVKQALFDVMERFVEGPRQRYQQLISDRPHMEMLSLAGRSVLAVSRHQ